MKEIQHSGESWQGDVEENAVNVSGQIDLECGDCGEHLFLLGREEDWPKEHRDAFSCRGCSATVTLAYRVDGTAYTIRSLLRSSIRPLGHRA